MMASADQSPRRSTTPKKKDWYVLVPEPMELSPPSRSHSRSSSRGSPRSSSSTSPAPPSRGLQLHEYPSPLQVSTLEEGPLEDDTQAESDDRETASQDRRSGGRIGDVETPSLAARAMSSGTTERLSPGTTEGLSPGTSGQIETSGEVPSDGKESATEHYSPAIDPGKMSEKDASRGPHVDHDGTKPGPKDLGSKSESVLSSGMISDSHASVYFDSVQSNSTIDITAGASRESALLDTGPHSSGNGISKSQLVEPAGYHQESGPGIPTPSPNGGQTVGANTSPPVGSSESSGSRKEVMDSSVEVGFQGVAEELSQYPFDDSEEGTELHDEGDFHPEVPKEDEENRLLALSSQSSLLKQEWVVHGAAQSNGNLERGYLEKSQNRIETTGTEFYELPQEDTVASLQGGEIQEGVVHEAAQSSGNLDRGYLEESQNQIETTGSEFYELPQEDTVASHPGREISMTEETVGQPLVEHPTSSVASTQQQQDNEEHLQVSSSSHDPQSSMISGSISGDSVQDLGGVRGSQVQLPLDLDSLQPLVPPSQVVSSRSGVFLDASTEIVGDDDIASRVSSSDSHSGQVLIEDESASSEFREMPTSNDGVDGRDGQELEGSVLHSSYQGHADRSIVSSEIARAAAQSSSGQYESEMHGHSPIQSRPSSGHRPDHLETERAGSRDGHLIRPSDLYGSPKDQSIEDTLARKVAQLLIESGQIAFIPKDKTGKTGSSSSSCSGSPDSIDGSLTPASQKDYAAQDIHGSKNSLSRQLSGRQSPASSVSSCTDSLALHVQQLLRESETLRARAPGRDAAGYGGQSDVVNASVVSMPSAIRRIIQRVDEAERRQGSGIPPAGDDLGDWEGRESNASHKRHSAEIRSSGHSSPRSQGRDSPYRSDSGRESPRYALSDAGHSPSHSRLTRSSIPVPQQHQRTTHSRVDDAYTESSVRGSLSQRVQMILASTSGDPPPRSADGVDTYVDELDTRYQGDSIIRGPAQYQRQDDVPLRRLHSEQGTRDDRYRDPSLGYYPQGTTDSVRRVLSDNCGNSVARRVQAVLMDEDAPKERVDRLLRETGVGPMPPGQVEDEFRALPQSESDPRLASFHTVPDEDEQQQPVIGSFAALERARANLEHQLQTVSERTFEHSITWETPDKHRKAESDPSFDRGVPGRPHEAWKDSRIPVRGQDYYGSRDHHQLVSDRSYYLPPTKSGTTGRAADEEFYSLPPSQSPSRVALRPSHDGSGARPRSYPQADLSTTPSYGRSQSIPSSGIPRRSLPLSASSTGSRTSQGRVDISSRPSDFTAQYRQPSEPFRDDGHNPYQSPAFEARPPGEFQGTVDSSQWTRVSGGPHADPPSRPMSATLPRSSDHSGRSTIGSDRYATTESILPQVSSGSVRSSLGESPERSILQPYRPPGSTETMYTYRVDGGREQVSSTIHSSTTMESTHIGSDDAQPPHFPPHVLGSRREPQPRDGSMIPRMSPRRYERTGTDVKGQQGRSTTPPVDGRERAQGREITSSSKSADAPLDLSRTRIPAADVGATIPRTLEGTSPTHVGYSGRRAEQDKYADSVQRDVHYAKLPPQTTESQLVFQGGQRSPAPPGVYSRRVLTDVLQDENSSLVNADEMWRQYQQRHLDETGGISSDETRIQKLASLIHDPVGHTARNIIREGSDPTKETELPPRTTNGSLGQEATKEKMTPAMKTESNKENVVATQTSFTSLEDDNAPPRRTRGRRSPTKRQKTGPTSGIPRIEPSPTERVVAAKAVTPTKRKAIAQVDEEEGGYKTADSELTVAESELTTAESVLSDLSLDSEQLLLLLGSHGVKKLSSKLIHLQQRIERQKEHHHRRKQAGTTSGKSGRTKHAAGRKKVLPRPTHASTPAVDARPGDDVSELVQEVAGIVDQRVRHAGEKKKALPRPTHASTPAVDPRPESGLVQEVAGIVDHSEETSTSPSTVSSLTTQATSDIGPNSRDPRDLDSVTTSESTLVSEPVRPHRGRRGDMKQGEDDGEDMMSLDKGRGGVSRQAKDDSEVEYRTSESDVSVLCSCRPTLQRPKSATEGRRSRDRDHLPPPPGLRSDGGFKRPLAAAPRIASRIPVKDKNGIYRMDLHKGPSGAPRGPSQSRGEARSFPRGTAFTIDLSRDLEAEEEVEKETPTEKGVLTDVPEKDGNGRRALVERKKTTVAKRGSSEPRTPPGIAWFQPYSKRMPWQEERPRPRPVILAALQQDPTTGKVSLQDAFLQHRPDFISQCRERQRKMKLAAEERHVQATLEIERQMVFEEQRMRRPNPLAHPYSTQLHKPAKRNLTKKEMKKHTSKIYSRLPEVVQKQEENKKQATNATNRIRAQIYRKKLKDRLRAGWQQQ